MHTCSRHLYARLSCCLSQLVSVWIVLYMWCVCIGATVHLVCRNPERGEIAKQQISTESSNEVGHLLPHLLLVCLFLHLSLFSVFIPPTLSPSLTPSLPLSFLPSPFPTPSPSLPPFPIFHFRKYTYICWIYPNQGTSQNLPKSLLSQENN